MHSPRGNDFWSLVATTKYCNNNTYIHMYALWYAPLLLVLESIYCKLYVHIHIYTVYCISLEIKIGWKKRYNNNTSFEFGGRNFQIKLSTLSQRVKNRVRLINNKPEIHNIILCRALGPYYRIHFVAFRAFGVDEIMPRLI